MFTSLLSFICPATYPSIFPSFHPAILPSCLPAFLLFILLSTFPPTHSPKIHLSTYPSIYPMCFLADPLGSTVSDKNPTENLAQISTLPPTTTKAQSTVLNSPRTVTQLLPKSTADISSPGFGVNVTNETDFTSYGFRSLGLLV